MIQFDSKNWEYLSSHGQASAELGEWDQAAADLDAALALPGCSVTVYADRAHLHLGSGNAEAYRRVCQRMVEVFGKQDSFLIQSTLSRTCSLSPSPPIPKDQLMRLAERADAKTPRQRRNTDMNILGVALFRAGRADDAIKKLDEAMKSRSQGGIVEDWLFLALAHQSLGHTDKAREWFARADGELKKAQTGSSRSDGRVLTWWLRIELDALFQEAKSALGEKTP